MLSALIINYSLRYHKVNVILLRLPVCVNTSLANFQVVTLMQDPKSLAAAVAGVAPRVALLQVHILNTGVSRVTIGLKCK